ncbi:PAS domain-containing protein, partial [Bacillus sp. JJ1474]|uniref:PAS domain-containing protein n=1 Tax=Bacillus sp. JJ1474 TaxID=3122955 RepID=UPI003F68B0A2
MISTSDYFLYNIDLFEKILDQLSDCVVAIDKNGFVIYINHTYCEILGVNREFALGQHVTE